MFYKKNIISVGLKLYIWRSYCFESFNINELDNNL